MPRPDVCEGQIVGQCAAPRTKRGQDNNSVAKRKAIQTKHKTSTKTLCVCVQTLWHGEIRPVSRNKQKPSVETHCLLVPQSKTKQINLSASRWLQNIYFPDKLNLVTLWTHRTQLVAAEGYLRSSLHRLRRRGGGGVRGEDAGLLTTMLQASGTSISN